MLAGGEVRLQAEEAVDPARLVPSFGGAEELFRFGEAGRRAGYAGQIGLDIRVEGRYYEVHAHELGCNGYAMLGYNGYATV